MGKLHKYNNKSIEALRLLGITWSDSWKDNVDKYVIYRTFCKEFMGRFGLKSLTDVDWFMYCIATKKIKLQSPIIPRKYKRNYADAINKYKALKYQVGYSDFKNNLINYPRPEWTHGIDDILAIAEHLYYIKDKVNRTGGSSVADLDDLLSIAHRKYNFRYSTQNKIFERLLLNPGGNRRHMRLFIQLAHLLGLINCCNFDVKRSNFMITNLVDEVIENQEDLTLTKRLFSHKLANFKIWGPFVGRLRSSEYYEGVSFRPICGILEYLTETKTATSFELGALFGFVPPNLYCEEEIIAHALFLSDEVFKTKKEEVQKINFCKYQGWVHPSPEEIAQSLTASYDPGFIIEELLRIMSVVGILEKQDNLWCLSKQDIVEEILNNVIQKTPLNLFEFFSNPDSLIILALIYYLNVNNVRMDIDLFKELLQEVRNKIGWSSIFQIDDAFNVTRELLKKHDIFFTNNSIQLTNQISFDLMTDVPGNQWEFIDRILQSILANINQPVDYEQKI